MIKNRFFKGAFAAVSLLGMLYCVAVYLYIHTALVPSLPEPTITMNKLGGVTMLFLLLAGAYHLYLLVHALQTLGDRVKHTFLHSLYIVLILLSGISLASDVTILSDLGKEYRLFDVRGLWLILYGCTALHIAVILYGAIFSMRNKPSGKRLFAEIKNGNDAMFLTIFQIGFLCGLFGIAGVVFSMSGILSTVITERYKIAYLFFLALLALLPAAIFVLYWAIRNKNKPKSAWFDEKQQSDTAASAMVTLAFAVPLSVAFIVASLLFADLPAPFWISLLLFTQIVVYTCSVIRKSKAK